jgi:Phosphotransferase enzyme family
MGSGASVRAEERRRLAVEAAIGVADALGVIADRPRILKDSNNTIVHVAPAPVVAKVGTSHVRDVELESLDRELAVAAFLVEREAPVIAPTRDVAPGPHRWGNLTLTLWQYAEPVRGAALDPTGAAAALSAVHQALVEFPCPLPPFSLELEDASRLLQRDRSPALAAADRSFLWSAVDELRVTLSGLATRMRPLHGSPHADNWLRTAEGWRLLDFETACSGPIEWDLAALDDAAVDLFCDVDRELIGLLRRMRSVCVAVKCWVEPSRAPEVFEAAHVHLKLLRGQPLL